MIVVAKVGVVVGYRSPFCTFVSFAFARRPAGIAPCMDSGVLFGSVDGAGADVNDLRGKVGDVENGDVRSFGWGLGVDGLVDVVFGRDGRGVGKGGVPEADKGVT